MILDKDLYFTVNSSGTVTPLAVPTTNNGSSSTAVIDLGAEVNPLGGHELTFHVVGNKGGSVTSSPTIKVDWQTSPNISSGYKTIATTPALPVVANGGVMYRMKIVDGVQRYNKAVVTTTLGTSGAVSSKTVDIFLTKEQ